MRVFLIAAVMANALAAAGAAQAQTPYDDPGRYNALQMQLEVAQRDALAAQQVAQAAQSRFDTETRLGALSSQRQTAAAYYDSRVYSPSLIEGAQIDAQMAADSARIAQLTDAALARSNARIEAIEPALP